MFRVIRVYPLAVVTNFNNSIQEVTVFYSTSLEVRLQGKKSFSSPEKFSIMLRFFKNTKKIFI